MSGLVTVTPSDSAHGITNPLYTGGLFGLAEGSVFENGQLVRGNSYLYNDNGAFYWQGDTAWAAAMRSTFQVSNNVSNPCTATDWSTNDWKCYLQDRKTRGFSGIQISVPQWWMKNPFKDTTGKAPFVNSATYPAWAQWNPTFWTGFESKIEYANEQGLVVFVVGLMEPSYQYLTDPITDQQRYPPTQDAQTFARNLAARLAGNFVIFSPGFDSPPSSTTTPLIQAVGTMYRKQRSGWPHWTMVVWEAEDLDGDRTGVFARRLDAQGQPQGAPFQVNAVSEGRQFEPVLASDAVGNYVVAWTNYSLADQEMEIRYRRFSASGQPLGSDMTANSKRPGLNRRAPAFSADPVGNLVLGWQEYAPNPGEWAVVVRDFDASGSPRAAERDVERSRANYLTLERLEMDALGNYQVIWQRVLNAQSQGHYARSSDHATHLFTDPMLVAGADQ